MSDRLLTVGDSFKMTFRTIDGRKFRGQMLDIPDTSRVTNFLSARRYLRVAPSCFLIPTDVVVVNTKKLLLGTHGDGFHHEPIYRFFKTFEVTDILPWQTQVTEENFVTGVEETNFVLQAEPVHISVQPKSVIEDSLKIPLQTYLALCNKPVQRGDILGPYVVTKVDQELGLYVVEMKDK